MSEVTRILQSIDKGDARAAGELLPLIYDELRKLAAARIAQEAPGQTLQATALVHEAWLKLAGSEGNNGAGRRISLARRPRRCGEFLIDKARRKASQKRGADPHARGAPRVAHRATRTFCGSSGCP